ncbi:MAG: hypothetical protein RI575_06610 [Balneolaceae bacterium]|nr:hypothetical protein [Balneolaceae bacterium]MDR9408434.1 hypothetical protein [Balneolaceae bacterium]
MPWASQWGNSGSPFLGSQQDLEIPDQSLSRLLSGSGMTKSRGFAKPSPFQINYSMPFNVYAELSPIPSKASLPLITIVHLHAASLYLHDLDKDR